MTDGGEGKKERERGGGGVGYLKTRSLAPVRNNWIHSSKTNASRSVANPALALPLAYRDGVERLQEEEHLRARFQQALHIGCAHLPRNLELIPQLL